MGDAAGGWSARVLERRARLLREKPEVLAALRERASGANPGADLIHPQRSGPT